MNEKYTSANATRPKALAMVTMTRPGVRVRFIHFFYLHESVTRRSLFERHQIASITYREGQIEIALWYLYLVFMIKFTKRRSLDPSVFCPSFFIHCVNFDTIWDGIMKE